jgi:hypothetical protein
MLSHCLDDWGQWLTDAMVQIAGPLSFNVVLSSGTIYTWFPHEIRLMLSSVRAHDRLALSPAASCFLHSSSPEGFLPINHTCKNPQTLSMTVVTSLICSFIIIYYFHSLLSISFIVIFLLLQTTAVHFTLEIKGGDQNHALNKSI